MGRTLNKSRLGEKATNSQGFTMTIVAYNNAKDITVEFDDKSRVNGRYEHFIKGSIKKPEGSKASSISSVVTPVPVKRKRTEVEFVGRPGLTSSVSVSTKPAVEVTTVKRIKSAQEKANMLVRGEITADEFKRLLHGKSFKKGDTIFTAGEAELDDIFGVNAPDIEGESGLTESKAAGKSKKKSTKKKSKSAIMADVASASAGLGKTDSAGGWVQFDNDLDKLLYGGDESEVEGDSLDEGDKKEELAYDKDELDEVLSTLLPSPKSATAKSGSDVILELGSDTVGTASISENVSEDASAALEEPVKETEDVSTVAYKSDESEVELESGLESGLDESDKDMDIPELSSDAKRVLAREFLAKRVKSVGGKKKEFKPAEIDELAVKGKNSKTKEVGVSGDSEVVFSNGASYALVEPESKTVKDITFSIGVSDGSSVVGISTEVVDGVLKVVIKVKE